MSHYCDCCDSNVLEHRLRTVVARWEHAPLHQKQTSRSIIEELRDALDAHDEQQADRQADRGRS